MSFVPSRIAWDLLCFHNGLKTCFSHNTSICPPNLRCSNTMTYCPRAFSFNLMRACSTSSTLISLSHTKSSLSKDSVLKHGILSSSCLAWQNISLSFTVRLVLIHSSKKGPLYGLPACFHFRWAILHALHLSLRTGSFTLFLKCFRSLHFGKYCRAASLNLCVTSAISLI